MYEYEATLVAVHDGDTITLDIDLGFSIHFLTPKVGNTPQSFRFNGYDAPELGRPDKLGEKAKAAVILWFGAHGGPYHIQTFKDHAEKYGRYLLDYVVSSVDNHELINDMVILGYLKTYTGSGPKPSWP